MESGKAYWNDRSANEAKVQAAQLSLEVTKARHIGDDPNVTGYNPDLWQDEVAYLNPRVRPRSRVR